MKPCTLVAGFVKIMFEYSMSAVSLLIWDWLIRQASYWSNQSLLLTPPGLRGLVCMFQPKPCLSNQRQLVQRADFGFIVVNQKWCLSDQSLVVKPAGSVFICQTKSRLINQSLGVTVVTPLVLVFMFQPRLYLSNQSLLGSLLIWCPHFNQCYAWVIRLCGWGLLFGIQLSAKIMFE